MVRKYKCYINNNILYIETSNTEIISPSVIFYIDRLSNVDNIHETAEDKHCKVVKSGGYTKETISDKQVIKIDISELEVNEVIVTIKESTNSHYLAYDITKMNEKLFSLLTTFCNTCIDKLQKTRIASALFRYILIQQAYELDKIEDAVKSYNDLNRILNISNSCTQSCIDNNACKTCSNGVCSL